MISACMQHVRKRASRMSLPVDKSAPSLQAVCYCARDGCQCWNMRQYCTLPTLKQMANPQSVNPETLTLTLTPEPDRTAAANRCNAWKGCCDTQEGRRMQSCCDSKAAEAAKNQDLSCTRRRLDGHIQTDRLELKPNIPNIRNPVAG